MLMKASLETSLAREQERMHRLIIAIEDDWAEFDWPAITRKLTDIIAWQVEIARIIAMPIPRLVAWFGDITYCYSGISHPPAPFPEVVGRLRRHAETLASGPFNSVLCNLYRSGRDSVGWHSDGEPGLGSCPTIAQPVARGSTPVSARAQANEAHVYG